MSCARLPDMAAELRRAGVSEMDIQRPVRDVVSRVAQDIGLIEAARKVTKDLLEELRVSVLDDAADLVLAVDDLPEMTLLKEDIDAAKDLTPELRTRIAERLEDYIEQRRALQEQTQRFEGKLKALEEKTRAIDEYLQDFTRQLKIFPDPS